MDSLLVRAHRRSLVSRESFRETLHTQAANTGVVPSDSIRSVQMILRPYFSRAQKRWGQVRKVGAGPTFRHVLCIRLAIPAARIEFLRSAKLSSLRCYSSMSLCPIARAVSGYCWLLVWRTELKQKAQSADWAFCSWNKRGSGLVFGHVPYIHPVVLPARQRMSVLSQNFQSSTLR